MKVGLVQLSIEDTIERNYQKIKYYLEKAAVKGIDLITFPEMCLTGYNINFITKTDWIQSVNDYLDKLKQLSKELDIALIVGCPIVEKVAYNAARVILPDGKDFNYYKMYLTAKEKECFQTGKKSLTFEYKGHKFGVIVCRDQNYPLLVQEICKNGAEALFILAAHYYNSKEARWKIEKNRAIPITRAVENNIPVFLANTVGPHLSMISLGNSLIADPDGALIGLADEVSETIVYCEI